MAKEDTVKEDTAKEDTARAVQATDNRPRPRNMDTQAMARLLEPIRLSGSGSPM